MSERMIKQFMEMVQIDSESGEEAAMIGYLEKEFRKLGTEAQQDGYGKVARQQLIQDVAANETICAGEQDFHASPSASDDAKFFADLLEFLQGAIDLIIRVRGHETDAEEFLTRRHSGRHHRIHKHALFLEPLAELEGLEHVVNVNRQDGRF